MNHYDALCKINDILAEYRWLHEKGRSWDWNEPIERISAVVTQSLDTHETRSQDYTEKR